jgi:hypothetical protein
MSTLAIVIVSVVGALVVVVFVGGLIVVRRRAQDPAYEQHLREADRALEQARAADRGWDRALLEDATRRALDAERPGVDFASIDLVLVDDRPGVTDDRAHLLAHGPDVHVRVILTRREGGDWIHERIE